MIRTFLAVFIAVFCVRALPQGFVGGGPSFAVPASGSGASSAVATTNICFTTDNVVSNVLRVAGAGTSAANGDYYYTGAFNAYFKGSFGVCSNNSDNSWSLTNGSATELYNAGFFSAFDQPVSAVTTWSTTGGAAPAPTVTYGSLTNCFTYVVASSGSVALPAVSTNLFVSESLGNDTNALRGRIDRKFRTLTAALSACISGDSIYIDPGDYSASGAGTIPSNVKIVGSGRNVTRINSPPSNTRLHPTSGFYVANLTYYGAFHIGFSPGAGGGGTNVVFDNIDVIGTSDAIEMDTWDNVTIQNCLLAATYDALADWNSLPGGSNRVCTVINSRLIAQNTNATPFGTIHAFNGGDSRLEMFGGSMEAYNGNIDNACVYLSVDTFRTNKTGSVLLRNVALRSITTNQISQFFTNFNRLPIFADNCTLEIVAPTLVSGSYTNQWSDRRIAIPNASARTNLLVDTTSLTNALVNATAEGHRVFVFDDSATAGGTNIWIATRGNQKINGGPTQTNIAVDRGGFTLMIRGTNWIIESSFP